jgi:diphosphomevalonate decarboxylase
MWISEAPSNVALIKYMGKQSGNIPCNASLSHTLNKFTTRVTLEERYGDDQFIDDMKLSHRAIDRFLQHLKNIKRIFDYNGFFSVKSNNNFPHSAGIASSSSSFAALTKCTITAICEIKGLVLPSCEEMSEISRVASGASCRSFFSPWSLWDSKGARKIDLKIGELNHDLVLVDQNPKTVSSSEAHERVKSSPLFVGRPQRAEKRLADLIDSLNNNRWNDACQICWEEFHDMHALFRTSSPAFEYMQLRTRNVLDTVEKFYKTNNDGPIVTIDAGPNVHFLWRKDQAEQRNSLLASPYIQSIY